MALALSSGKAFEAAANLRRIHEAVSEIRGAVVGAVPERFIWINVHTIEGTCSELYLKCLLIQAGTNVTQGGKMTAKMKSHDPREFFRKAGLKLTKSENQTLPMLTDAATYWGTYSISTHVKQCRSVMVLMQSGRLQEGSTLLGDASEGSGTVAEQPDFFTGADAISPGR